MRSRFVSCLFLATFIVAIVACSQSQSKLDTPTQPNLDYPNDKDTLVISLESHLIAGPPEIGQGCNDIPDLRVWGDGRIVFSQNATGQHRIVKTGNLDKSQIQSLLELIAKSSFFSPNTPEVPNPAGVGYELTVELKSGTYDYSWADQWTGPPAIYSDLIKAVEGYDLAEFTPEKALLVSSSYQLSYPPGDQLPVWPSRFSFSLASADKGTWISGDMLTFLWQSVNDSQYIVPGFQQDNHFYSIALEIPGISREEPPFDCWGSWKTILP